MTKIQYVPADSAVSEIVIKRSKFIGKAVYLDDPKAVKELVQEERELHKGCDHVAYGFAIGKPKSVTHGLSDDGEPRGTAGKPILEVIKGSGITNILVTVTRFFGKTKLGTGGLVKAYSESAKTVIENLTIKKIVPMEHFHILLPYAIYNSVHSAILECGGNVDKEDFTTSVHLSCSVPIARVDRLRQEVLDISAGTVDLQKPE
jgi:uncharacterized YigZ family protein